MAATGVAALCGILTGSIGADTVAIGRAGRAVCLLGQVARTSILPHRAAVTVPLLLSDEPPFGMDITFSVLLGIIFVS